MKAILTMATNKGGAGKSTVAVNLAVALAASYDVAVLDMDPQKSVSIFNRIRETEGIEPLNVITAETEREAKRVIDNNTGVLVIDTGAFDTPANRHAILSADMTITPTSSSSYDLYGLFMFMQKFETLKKTHKKFKLFALANRIMPRSKGYKDVQDFTLKHKKIFNLLESKLTLHADYQNGFDLGKGVTEIKKSTAAKEMSGLVKEILTWIK